MALLSIATHADVLALYLLLRKSICMFCALCLFELRLVADMACNVMMAHQKEALHGSTVGGHLLRTHASQAAASPSARGEWVQ